MNELGGGGCRVGNGLLSPGGAIYMDRAAATAGGGCRRVSRWRGNEPAVVRGCSSQQAPIAVVRRRR
jgi:hypothetical protein